MRWGINLRGDLAKLDDVEIAARYEALISEKEALIRQMPKYPESGPIYRMSMRLPWRGPLHARILYKLQYVLTGILTAVLGGGGPLPWNSTYEYYLMECELRDVADEIKSRVTRKKLSQSRS